MYLYTLELSKREGPKRHPTFVERGRTYMVQVLSHAPPFLNNVSLKLLGSKVSALADD